MPAAGFDFALDDKAIGDLVNYILSLNRLGTDAVEGRRPARTAQPREVKT